jgi:DNA-binding XRE family transcriptional regulator
MPKKTVTPGPPRSTNVPPEWALRVKALREEAGKTQAEVQKAIQANYNSVSAVETGRRKFSPMERHLFFNLIGKPEDDSIPTVVPGLRPALAKKAVKPTKPGGKKVAKAAKPQATKAGLEPKADPVASLGHDGENATPAPVPAAEAEAPEAPVVPTPAPARPPRPGRKPPTPLVPPAQPKPEEKVVVHAAPKPAEKPRSVRPVEPPPAHAPVLPESAVHPGPAVTSPVKDAVVRDITRVLANPGLSDAQAVRLHALFNALVVNALLGE